MTMPHTLETFQKAVENGDLEVVKAILLVSPELINAKKKFRNQDIHSLHIAAHEGFTALSNYLMDQPDCIVPADLLKWAILGQQQESVKHLVERGFDLNDKDITPLHQAVRCNDLGMIKTLVKLGADLHREDSQGSTALDQARYLGRTNLLDHLTELYQASEERLTLLKATEPAQAELDQKTDKTISHPPRL